jgi:hypothetical protein
MNGKYWVRNFRATDIDAIQESLNTLDKDGWEVVTSWTASGDPHINRGEFQVYILLKKRK